MDETLAALAAEAGSLVVGVMITDDWEGFRGRFARLIGHGDEQETTAAVRELDRSRREVVPLADPHYLSFDIIRFSLEAVRRQEQVWRVRLEKFLEIHPEAANELRALIGEITTKYKSIIKLSGKDHSDFQAARHERTGTGLLDAPDANENLRNDSDDNSVLQVAIPSWDIDAFHADITRFLSEDDSAKGDRGRNDCERQINIATEKVERDNPTTVARDRGDDIAGMTGKLSARISVALYLDTDDEKTIANVVHNLDLLVDLLGYDGPNDPTVQRGSFFRQSWARLKRFITSTEAQELRAKAERALELRYLDSDQADVDKKIAEAVTAIIGSLSEVPSACVRAGSILLIKYPGPSGPVIQTRNLSQLEIRVLEQFPEIQREPQKALESLAIAVSSSVESEAQPRQG